MWGENSNRENPVIHLPAFGTRLLGACLAPAWHLGVAYSTLHPYFFSHLRNHCCRNKPIDTLVSYTCSTTVESLGGAQCLPLYPLLLFPLQLRTGLIHLANKLLSNCLKAFLY